MKGKFITFEGIDGSGKTTIAKEVFTRLKNSGWNVILTLEPTSTWLGDAVKRSYDEEVSPFTELFLFLGDRATHTQQIKKWLKEGKTVLCDRYCDSTYAYQGAALEEKLKEFRIDVIEWMKYISKPFIMKPDLTILLVIESKIALQRLSNRKKRTKFENMGFLKKVEKNYLKLAKEERFVKIDARKSIKEIVDEVMDYIEELIGRP